MSGYADLRDRGVTFRPFDGVPPRSLGVPSPFEAPWGRTVGLLADELRHLGARNVVVELALGENDLRVDGLPRANARLASDAVRISFDSKWGPLRYETGKFCGNHYRGVLGWQANLRAIALAMEALRKVDRYGISNDGQQYRGWRQLPTGSVVPSDQVQTVEQAREVILRATEHLDDWGQPREETGRSRLTGSWETLVKAAIRSTHPDAGGDRDDFERVMKAKELLGV